MADATAPDISEKKMIPDDNPKSKESFIWIEEKPHSDWFVKVKNRDGQTHWFVRFKMTGLEVRRYGPFATKQKGLQFINKAVECLWCDGMSELESIQSDFNIPSGEFKPSNSFPILECAIAAHANTVIRRKDGE